jgi:hypothetical protein
MKNIIQFSLLLGFWALFALATPTSARIHAHSKRSIDDAIRRAQEVHTLSNPTGNASAGDFIQECSIKLTNFTFPDGYQLHNADQIQVFKTTGGDGSVGLGVAVLESIGIGTTRIHYYSSKIYCPRRCDVVYPSISTTNANNVLEATRSCELETTTLANLQLLTASRQEGIINWVAIGGGVDKEIMEAIVRQKPTYLRLFLATGEFFGTPTHDYVILTMHAPDGTSLNKDTDGNDIYYVMGDTFSETDGIDANVSTSSGWPPLPIN